ncbi:beta and beta-prime subunits of DNA dependent RNA-polymerase [Jaminaea rosea]|uniref:DNA-directed RNA polymerase subunit n=1 Tax=Jaminaea rosea TaxID=1569628 RepID=A0A316UPG8_9BASI|nr:beta and beta-prime subunits of DNA dependent RNA-polymerase [Jaminaea rosea]PWN27196.1 beta and beta-prime subunits of DNA dependent RNA-polymerase [Jaminaea rosea]
MDITRPISSTIEGTSFSLLSTKEIRAMSVKQITNPVLLDGTQTPTAGGLYDPAFGPMKKDDICTTCRLNHFQCPGHFGHIELPQPVFHPLFMTHGYNLLRGTCLFCHRFKIPPFQMILYIAKLRLLEYGLVQEADDIGQESLLGQSNFADNENAQLSNAQPNGADAADGDGQIDVQAMADQQLESIDEFRKRIDGIVGTHIYHATRRGVRRGQAHGQLAYAARKAVIAEFLKAVITQRKCRACQAVSPTLRKDGFIKIVEGDLSPKDKALHAVLGITRPDVIGGSSFQDASDAQEHQPIDKAGLKEASKASKVAGGSTRVMPPVECRGNLRRLFERESTICSLIFGRRGVFESGRSDRILGDVTESSSSSTNPFETPNGASADAFFMDVISVAPTRFRPASVMGDSTFENPQNSLLTNILKACIKVRELNAALDELKVKHNALGENGEMDEDEVMRAQKEWGAKRREGFDRLFSAMFQLQVEVNSFIDSSKNPSPESQGRLNPPGVKQALEKKEGLFRKHMMGKRVNFAARSVISPDVNIETNEIGVPPVFAKKLTYPEPVTAANVHLMRQLVINGPDKHPGAVAVRAEDGTETLLGRLTLEQRTALANQLLTPQEGRQAKGAFGGLGASTRTLVANKQVLRHLRDGDILLLNRQPTLHKPSMMAHRAKVLTGERTIRMHYANCNSYNADFDGDEMNMHFPQSQAARAECYNIANTDNQFLVPTSGKPLRGLIQDHVVAAVWMTSKNTLLTRAEYQQLLYGALRTEDDYLPYDRIQTLPPAILRPQPRWTGKQVISTILLNLKPANAAGLNIKSKAKVGGKYWGKAHALEQDVIIEDGELLSGVFDKNQIGASAYGTVHAVFELYGSESAGKLLSIFSRLFTKWLQHSAFTCRMDDLILSSKGDTERRSLLNAGMGDGKTAALDNVGLGDKSKDDPDLEYNLRIRLEEVLRDDSKMAALDAAMMSASNKLASSVIDSCIPNGLAKVFPENNMQMMTVSGAKGSPVNVSQISCLLGAQALEGRRVPTMISGKTLPSFKAFDTSMRAGGFIEGRFLTGIKPQEYYFHCMAGREGLIDTAVKTASSGYLQRCLIKHLEGYKVAYDSSVRNADGSVLQFNYGEDGLDTTRSKYLDQFDFTAQNFTTYVNRYNPKQLAQVFKTEDTEAIKKHLKKALAKPHKYAPVMSQWNPARYLGSMSESFARDVEAWVGKNASGLLKESKKSKNKRKHGDEDGAAAVASTAAKLASSRQPLDPERFKALISVLYLRGLVDPGESVGLLAAQGVGEPSTQMTLNTFHFAGHGAANVTLGIPRLREIVMTASQNIRTPIMKLPVLDSITDEQMRTFCKDGSRLLLSQVVENAVVTEKMSGKSLETGWKRQKTYEVRLNLFPMAECSEEYNVKLEGIFAALEATFVPILEQEIVKELKRLRKDRVRQQAAIGRGETFNDTPAAQQDDEAAAGDGDAAQGKKGSASAASAKAQASNRAAQDSDSDDEPEDEDEANNDGDADDAKRKRKAGAFASYEDVADSDDDEGRPDTAESIEAAFANSGKENTNGHSMRDGDDSDSEEEGDAMPTDIADRVANLEAGLQESSKFVTSFRFDSKKGSWASLSLQLGSNEDKLLLMNVVERACRLSVVHEIPRISRILIPPAEPGVTERSFTAEGINLRGIWDFAHGVVDLDRLYTNDVGALLHTYGVEAARAAIVAEMSGIFGTYGIDVSMRHLYLIADYQTCDGGFRPFSRGGIANNESPLLKASFEMTMAFLGQAALHGESDEMNGPSANLVVGRPVPVGTGSMQVRLPLPQAATAPMPQVAAAA